MNKLGKIKKLRQIIKESSYVTNKMFLLSVLSDQELKWDFTNSLPLKMNDLEKYGFLWNELIKGIRPFRLFKVFEKSISKNNADYLINFFKENYKNLGDSRRDELFQKESIDLTIKIIDKYPEYVGDALSFVSEILIHREGAYKDLSSKRDLERERDKVSDLIKKVFEIYKKDNSSYTENVIKLISNNFNLIGDDGEYTHYTPSSIFDVLREYVDLSFRENFEIVVQILIDQYRDNKWYGKKWNGWELMGSGISRSGDKLVIADRHFVSQVLEPVLFDYYHRAPKKTWKFIIDKLITSEEAVDADHPDFLNRASLKVILHAYAESNSDQSYKILKSFIESRKGIPHKTEMIFQIVDDGAFNLTDDQKWNLVKAQLLFKPYNNLPANILIERIVGDLAKNNNKEASKAIVSWSKNEDYVKRDVGGFMIAENSWKLLENKETFDEGFEAITNHIRSKDFINGDSPDSWEITRVLANALSIDFNRVVSLLQSIFDKDKLSKTEQDLVCYIPDKASNDKPELAIRIFNDFIEPNFSELDIDEIEKKIPVAGIRENLASYAEKLAKNNHFEEALTLLRKLVNDSDPNVDGSNVKNDQSGKFNLHKRIEIGDEVSAIRTVRGWSVYGLQKFITLGGQEHLSEVINLVDQLSKDSNYYVRMQSCIPLIDLARNRHTVLPGTLDRFMSFENAQRVENVAFTMLADKENHKLFEVMRHIGMVFTNIRTLSSKQAIDVLTTFNSLDFSHLDLSSEKDAHAEVLKEMVPLFLFYAEFRKDAYKESKIEQIVSDDYFNDLNNFDDREVKKLIKDILKKASDSVRSYFSWNLWKLDGDNTVDKERSFNIALKYMNMVIGKYSHNAFESVYRFVEDNLESKPNESLSLWMECLRKERAFLRKNFKMEKYHEMHWYPYFYNGKILLAVEDEMGKEEFLKWFEFLADYPKEVDVANDLLTAIDHLATYTTNIEQVETIFLKLIDRNASFYDAYEKWKNNK